jgi:hypothetical protein
MYFSACQGSEELEQSQEKQNDKKMKIKCVMPATA